MSGAIDRWRARRYLDSLDVMGDMGTGGAPSVAPDYGPDKDFVGPMTPSQLAALNRKLTPAEQATVDADQATDADRQLAAERKKGGPKSATVSVGPHGAVIKSEGKPPGAPPTPGLWGLPWWQLALAGLGIAAIGTGVVVAVK